MKNVLVIVFMVFGCAILQAQVRIKTEYFGESSLRVTEGEKDDKVGNSKGSALVTQASVNIPLSMKRNESGQIRGWGLGANGAFAKLNNRNFTEPLVVDEILNMNFNVNHIRQLNEKWSLLAALGAGIYMPDIQISDISLDHVLGNVGVIFIRHLKPNLQLGGGVALNNSFGYPMVFPAFYFNWSLEGRYAVNVAMLNGLEVSAGYKFNKKISLNLIAEASGQMALLKKEGKKKMFSHQYIVSGFRPEVKVGKYVTIPFTAGIHVMRPSDLKNRNLKSMFEDKGYYFQLSPYVSTGVNIEF